MKTGKIFKIFLFSLIFLLPIGCVMSKRYTPQPIVVRELTTLPTATKADSLYIFAENYVSHSGFDFSKANLRAVLLTLQNTSSGDYATMYEFYFTDFHGIGNEEYMPYPFLDAYTLLDNSTEFTESAKGAVVGTIGGAAIGTAMGAAIGAIAGDAGIGAAIGAVAGGTGGGFKGHQHYQAKASIAVDKEIYSRKIPEYFSVQPGSKITGVIFFPEDIHTIKLNIEGVNYNIKIHDLETVKKP